MTSVIPKIAGARTGDANDFEDRPDPEEGRRSSLDGQAQSGIESDGAKTSGCFVDACGEDHDMVGAPAWVNADRGLAPRPSRGVRQLLSHAQAG